MILALDKSFLVLQIQINFLVALTTHRPLLQLYLLGLPNKLGPLGFLALHHVLTTEETDATIAPTKVGEM